MPNTPNLAMPYLVASQAQKEVTHNDALNDLDVWPKMSVIQDVERASVVAGGRRRPISSVLRQPEPGAVMPIALPPIIQVAFQGAGGRMAGVGAEREQAFVLTGTALVAAGRALPRRVLLL